MNFLLLNVEAAYWNLYSAYVSLYANEQGLRQAHRTWLEAELKSRVGTIAESEVAASRANYELFRGDRITALNAVLEAERVLRALMGLPAEDGKSVLVVVCPRGGLEMVVRQVKPGIGRRLRFTEARVKLPATLRGTPAVVGKHLVIPMANGVVTRLPLPLTETPPERTSSSV